MTKEDIAHAAEAFKQLSTGASGPQDSMDLIVGLIRAVQSSGAPATIALLIGDRNRYVEVSVDIGDSKVKWRYSDSLEERKPVADSSEPLTLATLAHFVVGKVVKPDERVPTLITRP